MHSIESQVPTQKDTSYMLKSIHYFTGYECNTCSSFIQAEAGTISRGLARGE